MTALLILVMIAVPSACFAWLLRGLDPLGRAMVGVAAALCLLILVPQTMLIVRAWSPTGGLVAVGAICLLLAAAAWWRRPAAGAEAAEPVARHEDEDWIFDE
ncbi:hypothetical protein [Actinocorallia sp. A-T 12471]|uniref:hypothetical protein n=1 Tax=Actinocorallia sp. A-T 12471 TaxID=3089813 RepID=UPI0029CC3587|nr:hypothetical protein [Actinocorallia sp. A-T 12471]MDX6738979.1 hypothetical protein [Actinocorallia sp. A-T 12471]